MVELYQETGRDAEAATVAAEFLAKQEAWAPDRSAPHVAVASDPVPMLLAAELRAKTIDQATFDAARAAWVAKWKARVPPRVFPRIWVFGYAAVATTKALADEALAARAKLEALAFPSSLPFEDGAAIGRAYALAGDYEEARPYLERATHSLWALHAAIDETQMEALYGESLERTDKARACAAYDVVLGRWGGAKTSVTAARVSAKARALQPGRAEVTLTRFERSSRRLATSAFIEIEFRRIRISYTRSSRTASMCFGLISTTLRKLAIAALWLSIRLWRRPRQYHACSIPSSIPRARSSMTIRFFVSSGDWFAGFVASSHARSARAGASSGFALYARRASRSARSRSPFAKQAAAPSYGSLAPLTMRSSPS